MRKISYATRRLDAPDAGRVSVAGTDLATLSGASSARWRAAHVGYVFQQANLVPVLTAYENVEIPLWLFPMTKEERHRRVIMVEKRSPRKPCTPIEIPPQCCAA